MRTQVFLTGAGSPREKPSNAEWYCWTVLRRSMSCLPQYAHCKHAPPLARMAAGLLVHVEPASRSAGGDRARPPRLFGLRELGADGGDFGGDERQMQILAGDEAPSAGNGNAGGIGPRRLAVRPSARRSAAASASPREASGRPNRSRHGATARATWRLPRRAPTGLRTSACAATPSRRRSRH